MPDNGDEFIAKMCGSDERNLLGGLSQLLIWYAHNSAGQHVMVTPSDLDFEYARLPGDIGRLMRAIDPRTLAIVTHLTSRYLHGGDTIERAVKKIVDEAYLAWCQIT